MIKSVDLNNAAYNPRLFSDTSLKSLEVSMDKFKDISGITWNKETGNIVTGHHRWQMLCGKYGIDNLKFKEIKGTDKYLIMFGKEHTDYILRVVDWGIDKEKAANVTANSDTVEGKFTEGLQLVLNDISLSNDSLFKGLNLNELVIAKKEIKLDGAVKKEKKSKKSETLISGGGERYRTIKLELSVELADKLHDVIGRLGDKTQSVEAPLKLILDYIGVKSREEIINYVRSSKTRKKVRRKNNAIS